MATTIQNVILRSTVAPRLPNTTIEYDRHMLDQLTNILRIYFNQLDNFTQSLISSDGGQFLSAPYGAFQDIGTQSAPAANTATLMLLRTTDYANRVSISSSRITVDVAGIYNFQFSVQVQNFDNAPQDMFVWLRQNGVDIVGSTGVIGAQARKTALDPYHDIKGWNYFLSMNAGDYVELYYSVTNALVTIESYVASVLPTKPSTASVVATMSFVSALPALQ